MILEVAVRCCAAVPRHLSILSIALWATSAAAQQQPLEWPFGSRCRLSFPGDGGAPQLQTDPSINTGEGSSAFGDPLRLYTDGITVWRPDGGQLFTGLPGDPSSMHSAVIVPVPGSSDVLVFAHASTVSTTVGYQRVGPTGALVGPQGQVLLPGSSGREGMLAIQHANGVDWWLLVSGDPSLYVIPVTAAGVGTATAVATGLTVWNNGWHVFAASPQGTTVVMSGNIALASNPSDIVAWDFDPSTGALTNRRVLNPSFRRQQLYGGAFSLSGEKLYFSTLNEGGVTNFFPAGFYQYDFADGGFTRLGAAMTQYVFGDARLGPDGVLYVAGAQAAGLHTVRFPEAPGLAATFTADAVLPPPVCNPQQGLPQLALPRAPSRPVIVSQPMDVTVFETQPFSLSVGADGGGLSFQWRKDGGALPGATAATFMKIAAAGDQGAYDVMVSNAVGAVTSAPATVTVLGPPAITSQPSDVTVFASQPLMLSVGATGASLAYQWRLDAGAVAGATTPTFMKTAAVADRGRWDVVVSNPAGSVTSSAVTVIVHGPPSISQQPADAVVLEGDPFSFSVTALGESLAYQWQRDDGGVISGATAATYSGTAALTESGGYQVMVTNPAGSVASQVARLTVVVDAGVPDAGPPDAGSGPAPDAGSMSDAGEVADAGAIADAGTSRDAGAGGGSGADAGLPEPAQPRGCGCSAAPELAWVALLALARRLARKRRAAQLTSPR